MLSKKSVLCSVIFSLVVSLGFQLAYATPGKTRVVKATTVKRHRPDSLSVVLSSKRIDLTDLDLTDPATPKTFTVNVIFGKAVIVIKSGWKLRINANPSFFASVKLPDNTKISSSDDSTAVYEANLEDGNGNPMKPEFFINANATFGSIIIITEE